MLEFVKKSEYWRIQDSGIESVLRAGIFPWHLKSVQDGVAIEFLKDYTGKVIAEVGGGDSRILPYLARSNSVYNIEPYSGNDGGPNKKIEFDGVINFPCLVGKSEQFIQNEIFDVLFSISVVEHLQFDDITQFYSDCARILKPGGVMFHAVDLYIVTDDGSETANYMKRFNEKRISLYKSCFDTLFEPLSDIEIKNSEDIAFHTAMATNPDNIMQTWNKSAPKLAALRSVSQSVCIKWGGRKK